MRAWTLLFFGTVCLFVLAVVQAGVLAQAPEENAQDMDAKKRLERFIETHKLRLATTGETAAEQFHFTMRFDPLPHQPEKRIIFEVERRGAKIE